MPPFPFEAPSLHLSLAARVTLAVGAATAAACGSSSPSAPHDSGAPHVDAPVIVIKGQHSDAGDDARHESGTPDAHADAADGASLSTTYPAFSVNAPQIIKNQGTVLASPVIVTVTWPGDPYVATWEAFDDAIGASTYWSMTTSAYGVGPSVSGPANHVRMTQPLPASLSYTDLQNFVIATLQAMPTDGGAKEAGATDAGNTDGGPPNPSWPAPTLDSSGNDQTIYSLFIAESTTVTDPGSGMPFCTEGGLGYHDDVVVGGKAITYSVTLECASQTLPDLEETAAHETVEAATNPYPESMTLGYAGFDPAHLAWDLYTGFNDELADACQNWQDSYFEETGSFPYWVQSSWSNMAAAAGQNPCVPHAANPYYGVTLLPSQTTNVTVPLEMIGAPNAQTQGFKVKVGMPLTFQVGFFSDAAVSAPWTISYDFPQDQQLYTTTGYPLGNGSAVVSLDRTSGTNGETANVTMTVTKAGPGGFHLMAITWDNPTSTAYLPHYLPIVLVDE